MSLVQRKASAILFVVGLIVAPGVSATDSGEIWVTAQNASELKILLGNGGVDTVTLPTGAQPHTINFSPDGSYAFVSNLGDGTLMVVRSDDRQIVATLDLGATFTHDTKSSPDGSFLLSANPITGLLTRIAANEAAENWTPDGSLDLRAVTGQGPVCAAFRSDGARAYVSLFGAAGGIAVVDVASMAFLGKLPTAGSVACGLVNSKDGRTMFIVSNGGTGHLYRLDTETDTLTEETGYGPIGLGLHGLITTANEKDAYTTAVATDEVKILDLDGSDVRTISLDRRPGIRDSPDSIARRGGNIYVTLRFAGQVARIQAQSGRVDYIDLTPPATSGYAVHGIAVRP